MGELPQPQKRKPLTRREFATLILAQEGRCGCGCGKKLQADRIIDEHLTPLDSLGSNALENRALYDRDCAKRKTKTDRAARDKGRRIRGEVGQGPKRPIPSRPLIQTHRSEDPKRWQAAGRKIQSRGFDRTKSKGFDGKIRERTQ
jgi:hypothetical protein